MTDVIAEAHRPDGRVACGRSRLGRLGVVILSAFVPAPASAAEMDLPPVNAAVVAFCEANAGEKIGDGQCSSVAEQALEAAGGKPFRDFEPVGPQRDPAWGEPVERMEDVLPGDVMQFRDVTVLVRSRNGTRAIRSFPHHTAVVARNRGAGVFDLYEQNVISAGSNADQQQKMRRRQTDFRGMTGGTVRVYRPVAKAAEGD